MSNQEKCEIQRRLLKLCHDWNSNKGRGCHNPDAKRANSSKNVAGALLDSTVSPPCEGSIQNRRGGRSYFFRQYTNIEGKQGKSNSLDTPSISVSKFYLKIPNITVQLNTRNAEFQYKLNKDRPVIAIVTITYNHDRHLSATSTSRGHIKNVNVVLSSSTDTEVLHGGIDTEVRDGTSNSSIRGGRTEHCVKAKFTNTSTQKLSQKSYKNEVDRASTTTGNILYNELTKYSMSSAFRSPIENAEVAQDNTTDTTAQCIKTDSRFKGAIPRNSMKAKFKHTSVQEAGVRSYKEQLDETVTHKGHIPEHESKFSTFNALIDHMKSVDAVGQGIDTVFQTISTDPRVQNRKTNTQVRGGRTDSRFRGARTYDARFTDTSVEEPGKRSYKEEKGQTNKGHIPDPKFRSFNASLDNTETVEAVDKNDTTDMVVQNISTDPRVPGGKTDTQVRGGRTDSRFRGARTRCRIMAKFMHTSAQEPGERSYKKEEDQTVTNKRHIPDPKFNALPDSTKSVQAVGRVRYISSNVQGRNVDRNIRVTYTDTHVQEPCENSYKVKEEQEMMNTDSSVGASRNFREEYEPMRRNQRRCSMVQPTGDKNLNNHSKAVLKEDDHVRSENLKKIFITNFI